MAKQCFDRVFMPPTTYRITKRTGHTKLYRLRFAQGGGLRPRERSISTWCRYFAEKMSIQNKPALKKNMYAPSPRRASHNIAAGRQDCSTRVHRNGAMRLGEANALQTIPVFFQSVAVQPTSFRADHASRGSHCVGGRSARPAG